MKPKRITRRQAEDMICDKFLERLERANKLKKQAKSKVKKEWLNIEPIDL